MGCQYKLVDRLEDIYSLIRFCYWLLKVFSGYIICRTKLKQTEVDCEYLKRCCETLTEENRRLQKELQELRALKTSQPFYMQLPATTLTMCPSCERVATTTTTTNGGAAATTASNPAVALAVAKPRPYPFSHAPQSHAHQAASWKWLQRGPFCFFSCIYIFWVLRVLGCGIFFFSLII